MNRYGLALVTLNALALVACVMIVAGQLLSGEQLRTAIPDTTATSTKGDWVTYYGANGVAGHKTTGGTTEPGGYRISDDGKLCLKFNSMNGGKEVCEDVYLEGSVYHSLNPNGTVDDWTLVPGTVGM